MTSNKSKGLEAFITKCPLGALLILLVLVLSVAGLIRQITVQKTVDLTLEAGETPYIASAFKEPIKIEHPLYVVNLPDPPEKPDPTYDPLKQGYRLIPPEDSSEETSDGENSEGTEGETSENSEGETSESSEGENAESSEGENAGESEGSETAEGSDNSGSSDDERKEEKEASEESEEGDDHSSESIWNPFRDEPRDPVTPRSSYYSDPARHALDTDAPYQTVDNSYFENSLFIGDSRIDGIGLFSDIKNADFLCKTGIMIYTVLDSALKYRSDGVLYSEEVYLEDVLKEKTYDRIYLMMGVNELGMHNDVDFYEEYSHVVEEIQKLQPQATIFILAIMNVSKSTSDGSSYLNNDNINARNWQIAHIADGKTSFYLEVNTAVCDEKGFLRDDFSNDGVHLRSDAYIYLTDFLRQHAIL